MLIITTPCFAEGGWIPDYNAGFGEDKSPEFHIEGIDAEADAECIPGGIDKGSVVENPIHIEQGIAYGKHCYRGPKPPFNWNHGYLFTLYILDCTLEADRKSRKEDILKLAEGLLLASDNVFCKTRADAFSSEELVSYLNSQNITEIEIIGVDGNSCINASAKGAIKKGYVVLINLSCIGVANPLRFEKTKETLSAMGVIIKQS